MGLAHLIEIAHAEEPELPRLHEMRKAAERCACITEILVTFSLKHGVRCPSASLPALTESE